MRQIKTGIRNLDKLVGGGLPEKETILVEGEPGAGKTNMGLEYLYRGAEKGEKGLFVSFQETKDEIIRTTTFDWDFDKHVEQGKVNIRKMDPYRYEQVPDMLRGMIKENSAKRIVIDPITDLDLYIDSRKDIRKNLLALKTEVENASSTALLLAESEEATSIEEEIAGGIINMGVKKSQGKVDREIFIKKLKGSDYNHGIHKYEFDSKGLKVL